MERLKDYQIQWKMVEAAEEAGVHIFTDLVNQITLQGVILAEQELRSIGNCYKEQLDCLRKRKLQGVEVNRSISEES